MTSIRHGSVRVRLAEEAARKAGLVVVSAEAASEDPGAREIRDSSWAEYERRLRDVDTYALRDIREWLATVGVEVSQSCIHRDRVAVLEPEKFAREAAAGTRILLADLARTTDEDLFRANRTLVANAIYQALVTMRSGALEDLGAGQFIRLADVISRMSVDRVQADVLAARLAAMRDAAKKAVDEKIAAAPSGSLTREDVYRILDEVMKGEAA